MFIYFIFNLFIFYFFFSERCDFERDEEVNGIDTLESPVVQNVIFQQTETQQSMEDDFSNLQIVYHMDKSEIIYPSSRFICDVGDVIKQARKIETHTYECNFGGQLIFNSIKKNGLGATLNYICSNPFCSKKEKITTVNDSDNLNQFAVLGALATGSGFSQEEEKFSTMNVEYMSNYMFSLCERKSSNIIETCVSDSLEQSISKEKQFAEIRGDMDDEGYYHITVIADGGWCKRSYGHGYNSSSGVAVIIGLKTKHVLFMGVRNKSCMICEKQNETPTNVENHTCFKNWTQPSTAMESDIIVEGLNHLLEKHRIKCSRMIADGDSNIMSKIREKVPYGRSVLKIECANHAIRRYGKGLEKLRLSTAQFSGQDGLLARKLLKSKTPSLIRAMRSLLKEHAVESETAVSKERVDALTEDMRNCAKHVLGQHDLCRYTCTKKGTDNGNTHMANLQVMTASGMFQAIDGLVNRTLAPIAHTLIFNVTNNPAEQFMAQLCKTYGGKRVDFSRAGGINRRANIAVLSYQTPAQGWHAKAHRIVNNGSPRTPLRRFTSTRRKRHLKRRKLFPSKTNVSKKMNCLPAGGDKSYGEEAEKPDMEEDVFATLSKKFLDDLQVTSNDQLESVTREQYLSERWRNERAKRISSSHFKDIADRRVTTKSSNLVKRLIYKTSINTPATRYGLANEKIAREKYEQETGFTVNICGLFIDKDHPFLCTSPDGLVGTEGLVEIKCPYSARSYDSLEETSKSHSIGIQFQSNGAPFLPTNHKYHYQIQGQLAITGRKWCDLFFWSDKDSKSIRIWRDVSFWEKILAKLRTFYMDCVLPELVDPRASRNMNLREPQYIIDAIEKMNDRKKQYIANAEKKYCNNNKK